MQTRVRTWSKNAKKCKRNLWKTPNLFSKGRCLSIKQPKTYLFSTKKCFGTLQKDWSKLKWHELCIHLLSSVVSAKKDCSFQDFVQYFWVELVDPVATIKTWNRWYSFQMYLLTHFFFWKKPSIKLLILASLHSQNNIK